MLSRRTKEILARAVLARVEAANNNAAEKSA
jgi:hypothetical protein